ncbi:hypothetical protein JZ751_019497 [Albula glossodonta]|uniref:Uncharacterized protein n=1 Tax=Albula glossodonta TaxID=121402 RepID=A0A8T2MZ18_9TELE|nr:hypothetical protein JZ751_019497 [Albula glossodonta]
MEETCCLKPADSIEQAGTLIMENLLQYTRAPDQRRLPHKHQRSPTTQKSANSGPPFTLTWFAVPRVAILVFSGISGRI